MPALFLSANKEQHLIILEKIRFRNQIADLSAPIVMGILNTTPDSFSDGGKYLSIQQGVDRIGEMVENGASIIDIGGESTRPGADPVSDEEELSRVIPVFEKALKEFPEMIFSADTTKYRVASESLKAGVHIINDVSGLYGDVRLAGLCAAYDAGYVLMHTQGDPKTMQKNPFYQNVIEEIGQFFSERVKQLQKAGVQTIILDPGIGFGKTKEHNLRIIQQLEKFTTLDFPILVGASRKTVVGEVLNGRKPEGRLAGTISIHYHSLINGANILRVHDVKEAADSIKIYNALQQNSFL